MKKRFIVSALMVLLLGTVALAQNSSWEYGGTFKTLANVSGIASDPLGQMWYASKTAESGIIVVNQAGTPTSYSPIMSVTVDGRTIDTKTGCSGLQTDRDGYIYGIFNGNDLVKMNPFSGAGIAYVQIPEIGSNKELSNFAIDDAGNIYFTHVTQPAPIQIYGPNFVKIKDAVSVATTAPQCKAVTVTNNAYWPISGEPAGIQLYAGPTGGSGIAHYRAVTIDDPFVPFGYEGPDNPGPIAFPNVRDVEAFNWDGGTANCWISLGTDKRVVRHSLGADRIGGRTEDITFTNATFQRPCGIVFVEDVAFIADYDAGLIHRFNEVPFKEFGNWKFVGQIGAQIGGHGVAVTPDGLIWIGAHYNVSGYPAGNLMIFYPDGTLKEQLTGVTIRGTQYPFATGASPVLGSRGLFTDYEGNVLYSSANTLYKIDGQTYQGLARYVSGAIENSLTNAVADENGYVVLSHVIPSNSLNCIYLTPELEPLGTLIPGSQIRPSISRLIAMTPSGEDLFFANSSGTGVSQWHSDDGVWGQFAFMRFIGDYPSESNSTVTIDKYGRLWIGSAIHQRYDCWDLNTMQIVDGINSTLKMDGTVPAAEFANGVFKVVRGLAFSPDMKYAYTTDYTNNTGIQVWEYQGEGQISVEEPKVIPEGFALSQNYPNPFNPSTKFTYSLPKASDVKVVVYDLFGREIKTLVNETKEAGTYNIAWDGKDNHNRQVATGVYFYKMQAAGFEKTMKMMLVK
jgi:sugar lactone lactonase YvrE